MNPYRESEANLASLEEEKARAVIRPHLTDGETLLWADKPSARVHARSVWWLIPVLFASPFLAAWIAHGNLGAIGITLFATLALAGFPIYSDARRRAETTYALTNARLLVIVGGTTRTMTAVQLEEAANVAITGGNEERGTIVFGANEETFHHFANIDDGRWSLRARRPASAVFEGVRRPLEVLKRIREARAQRLGRDADEP